MTREQLKQLNKAYRRIAKHEGLKSEVSIANIREIFRVTGELRWQDYGRGKRVLTWAIQEYWNDMAHKALSPKRKRKVRK